MKDEEANRLAIEKAQIEELIVTITRNAFSVMVC